MEYEPDYSKYTLDELFDAASHINREKYEKKARLIDDEIAKRSHPVIAEIPIEEKYEEAEEVENVIISDSNEKVREARCKDDRIIKITNRLKIVFFVFTCIGIIITIKNLSNFLEGDMANLEGMINTLIFLFIYIGLRLRKGWLIPLIVIYSALSLIGFFVTIFQPTQDVIGILIKVGFMMLIIFYIYLMYFFSRREVKAYFSAKETIIF